MDDPSTPAQAITTPDDQARAVAGLDQQAAGRRLTIEETALAWLKTKAGRTGSPKTKRDYSQALVNFDAYLQARGCQLDGDPREVGRHAQEWAAHSFIDGGQVSSSTTNQRLAILSSFYRYAITFGPCDYNPVDYAERPPRRIEHAAPYLEDDEVTKRLQAINTTTKTGKRDKALLSIALTTGRRASELAGLHWQDIMMQQSRMIATFHCKGGKVMQDELEPRTIAVLLDYLRAEYGQQLEHIREDSPIFVSYSNNHRGGKLSYQAIADICLDRLGVSQVHSTRHTFAVGMDDEQASLSEIGERLGHSNYQVTAQYMKRLRSGENKHASKLARRFGI
jgi:integrase